MGAAFRSLTGTGLATATFLAFAVPGAWMRSYPLYGLYLAAEKLGLLTNGAIGAMRILGRYFHGPPATVRYIVEALTALVAYAPALSAACAVYQWTAFGPRATRCGHCRRILRNLTEPRCPHCGQTL